MIYISLYSLCMQNVMLFKPHDLSCGSEHHEISSENGSSDEEMQFTPPACTTPQLTHATPEASLFSSLSPNPTVTVSQSHMSIASESSMEDDSGEYHVTGIQSQWDLVTVMKKVMLLV